MKKLSNMLVYDWKQGLKTVCYYLRIRPASTATKFTVESDRGAPLAIAEAPEVDVSACSMGCVVGVRFVLSVAVVG
jgi:ribonucleotide reductase alpha subunit